MKTIFLTLSMILVFTFTGYAQEEVESETKLTYSAEEFIKLDSEEEIITLFGNANLKTDLIEFKNADKIIINKESEEILVIGEFTIIFKDGIIKEYPESKKHHLRYKIGEKIAYME